MKNIEYLTEKQIKGLKKIQDLHGQMAIYKARKYEYIIRKEEEKYRVFAKYKI